VAKSVADATKSATATITVTAVSIAVSPQIASAAAGNTVKFTAAVTGRRIRV
jgi:uncharacterized protein YjdB